MKNITRKPVDKGLVRGRGLFDDKVGLAVGKDHGDCFTVLSTEPTVQSAE